MGAFLLDFEGRLAHDFSSHRKSLVSGLESSRSPLTLIHDLSTAKNINEVIKTVHVPSLQGIEYEGQKVPPPTQLPWYVLSQLVQQMNEPTMGYCCFRYPGGLAWAINVHKTTIRRVAEFKELQNFLVYEAEVVRLSSSFRNGTLISTC
jgi:multisite-specific tRNA:(cytosine-C5)-methyltransferase